MTTEADGIYGNVLPGRKSSYILEWQPSYRISCLESLLGENLKVFCEDKRILLAQGHSSVEDAYSHRLTKAIALQIHSNICPTCFQLLAQCGVHLGQAVKSAPEACLS